MRKERDYEKDISDSPIGVDGHDIYAEHGVCGECAGG